MKAAALVQVLLPELAGTQFELDGFQVAAAILDAAAALVEHVPPGLVCSRVALRAEALEPGAPGGWLPASPEPVLASVPVLELGATQLPGAWALAWSQDAILVVAIQLRAD